MTTRLCRGVAVLVGLMVCGVSVPAHADARQVSSEIRRSSSASITVSPVHLMHPSLRTLEVTAEFPLGDRVGLAAIGAYGHPNVDPIFGGSGNLSLTIIEAGAQLRYYVTGGFRNGAHLGIEALATRITNDDNGDNGISVTAGPLLGYKFYWAGIALDLQVGLGVYASSRELTSDTVLELSQATGFSPFANINAGFTF